jgi:hypothetical protein
VFGFAALDSHPFGLPQYDMFQGKDVNLVSQEKADAVGPLQRVASPSGARGQRCCAPVISLMATVESGYHRNPLRIREQPHCQQFVACVGGGGWSETTSKQQESADE